MMHNQKVYRNIYQQTETRAIRSLDKARPRKDEKKEKKEGKNIEKKRCIDRTKLNCPNGIGLLQYFLENIYRKRITFGDIFTRRSRA